MHVEHAEKLQNFRIMNMEATHVWIGVGRQYKLDSIYWIPEAIFDMDNYGHEFRSRRRGMERGARGLRFRRCSFMVNDFNIRYSPGTEKDYLHLHDRLQ